VGKIERPSHREWGVATVTDLRRERERDSATNRQRETERARERIKDARLWRGDARERHTEIGIPIF